jgi:hypothetical protein
LQPRIRGLRPGWAALAQADRNFHTGLVQVERMRVPLRSVSDDRDLPPLIRERSASLVRNRLS